MAVAQQQSCSPCDSTSGQKRTRPSSRWPKSSLQEPGRRETISSLALITSVTRQEGLQTTGISSSTSAYRNTDVEEKGVHCVQLSPGCSPQLQSSVSSSEYSQPGWGIPPHIPFTDTLPHGGRQPVLTSTPLPGAIPMQKWLFQKLFGISFSPHCIIPLPAPLVCSSFKLFFWFLK